MANTLPAVSLQDAADALSLSVKTVRRAIGAGELRAAKIRGQYRIRVADLDAWFDRHVVKTANVRPMRVRRTA